MNGGDLGNHADAAARKMDGMTAIDLHVRQTRRVATGASMGWRPASAAAASAPCQREPLRPPTTLR